MENNYKRYVDWDKQNDWQESKPGRLSSEWVADKAEYEDDEGKAKLIDYLNRQDQIFRILSRILKRKHDGVSQRKLDVSKENFKDALMYHEGYMAALRDVNKILPRPRGT